MLNVVGKIYVVILVDRVCSVTQGLIDDEQGGFRVGRGYLNHIFKLREIGEKAQKKNAV